MASSFSPRREHARVRRVHGQNFLIDPAAVRLRAAGGDDLVYEVGAGRGRVTAELLRLGAHVVAFEPDETMARDLPRHRHLDVRVRRPDEVRSRLERLNLDAARFRQLSVKHGGAGAAVRAEVLEIIGTRGKMHNPVTGSGSPPLS